MISLEKFLNKNVQTTDVQKILLALADASREIYISIRLMETKKDANQNSSGDTQSKLDITSDKLFIEHLTKTNLVKTIASEEQENLIEISNSTKQFFVAYDPYDGGGVGDVNMTFGSIIGLWFQNPIGSAVGKHLIAGCYALYGPRLTLVISLGNKPSLFEYNVDQETFILRDQNLKIAASTTHFSPGNLRNMRYDENYRNVMEHWITSGYKLLYAGALVTDINHILMKGHGIFTYPSDKKYTNGKLRLLYEGGPLGFIIEAAGGKACTQLGDRLLDKHVTQTHQRESFILGSSKEVDHVTQVMSSNM